MILGSQEDTFNFHGREIPLWKFETVEALEQFVDTLTPESWSVHVREDLFPIITGFIYNDYPMTDDKIVAAFDLTEERWATPDDVECDVDDTPSEETDGNPGNC